MEIKNVKIKSVDDLFEYVSKFDTEGYKQKTGKDIDPDMKSMIQRIKNGDEYLKNVEAAINGNKNLTIKPDDQKLVTYRPRELSDDYSKSLRRIEYDAKYKLQDLNDDFKGHDAATFLKFLFLLDLKQIEMPAVIFCRLFYRPGGLMKFYSDKVFLETIFDKNQINNDLIKFVCWFGPNIILKPVLKEIVSIPGFESLKNYFSDEGLIIDETYAKKILDNMNVVDYGLVELFSGLKNCKPESKIGDDNLRKVFYTDLARKCRFSGDGAIAINNIIPDDLIESDEIKLIIAEKNKQQLDDKIGLIINLSKDEDDKKFFGTLKTMKEENVFLDSDGNVVNLPEKRKIKVNCDAFSGENLAIRSLDKESDNPLVIIDSLLMSKLHGYVLGDKKSWSSLFSYLKNLSRIGFVLKVDQKNKKYFIPQNNGEGIYMGIRYDALIGIMKQAAEDKKISSLDDLKTFLSLFDLTGFNNEYKKSFLDACIEVIKNNSLKSSDFDNVVKLFEKTFGNQNESLRRSLLKEFNVVDENIIDEIKPYSMPIHDFSGVKLCTDIEQLRFISTAFQKLKIELEEKTNNDEKKKYILEFISNHIADTKIKSETDEDSLRKSNSDIAVACVIFGEENIKNIFDGIEIPKYRQEDKNKEENQKALDALKSSLQERINKNEIKLAGDWESDLKKLEPLIKKDTDSFKKWIKLVENMVINYGAKSNYEKEHPSSGEVYDLFNDRLLEGFGFDSEKLDKTNDQYLVDVEEYKNRLGKLEEIRLKENEFKSKIEKWKSLTYYDGYVKPLTNGKTLEEETKDVADKDLGDFLIKLMEETENIFANRQALEKLVADNEFDKNREEYLNLLAVNKLKLNSNDYENNLRYFKENTIDVEKNKSANKKLLNDTFEKYDSLYKKCFDPEYAGEETANYFKEELGEPNKTGDEDCGLYALTHGFENEFLPFFNTFKEKLDAFISLKDEIEGKYNENKDGFNKLGKSYEAKINNLKSKTEIEKADYAQTVNNLSAEFLTDLAEVQAEETAEANRKENQKSLDILKKLKEDFEMKYGQLSEKYSNRISDLSSDNLLREATLVYNAQFVPLKSEIESEMAKKEVEKLSAVEKENNKNVNQNKLSAKENEWKGLVADYMEIETISSQINGLKKDEILCIKPEDYDKAIASIDSLVNDEVDAIKKRTANKTENLEVLKTFKAEIENHKTEFKDLAESFLEEKKDDLDENNKKLEDNEPKDFKLFVDILKNEFSNKITTEKQNRKSKNKEINEPKLNTLRQDEKYNNIKNSREQAVNILQNMLYLTSDEFDSELSKSKDGLDGKLKVLNNNKKKLNDLVTDKKYDEVKEVFNKDIEKLQKMLSDPQDDFDKPSCLNDFDNNLKALKDKLDDELKNNEQKKENMKKNQEALDAIWKKTEYVGITTKANIKILYDNFCAKEKLEKPVDEYKKLLTGFENNLKQDLKYEQKLTNQEREQNKKLNNDVLDDFVKNSEFKDVCVEDDYKNLKDNDMNPNDFRLVVLKNLKKKLENRLESYKDLKDICEGENYEGLLEGHGDEIKALKENLFKLPKEEFDKQKEAVENKLSTERTNKNLEVLNSVVNSEKYKDVIEKDEIKNEVDKLKKIISERSLRGFKNLLEALEVKLENELKILADNKQKDENKKENKKAMDAIWNNKDYKEIIKKPDVKFLYDSLCDKQELEKPVDEYKKLLADFENKLKQRVEKEKNLTQDNRDNNKKANNNYLDALIKNDKFKDVCREEDYKNLKDSDMEPEEFKSLSDILNKKLDERLRNKKSLDEVIKNKNYGGVIKKYNNEIKDLEKKLFELPKDEFTKLKEKFENKLLDEIKTENLGILDTVIKNEKYEKVIKKFETRVDSLYSKASAMSKKEFGEEVKKLENDLEEFFKLENPNSLDDVVNSKKFEGIVDDNEIKKQVDDLKTKLNSMSDDEKNKSLKDIKDKLNKKLETENLEALNKVIADVQFAGVIEIKNNLIDKCKKIASKTPRNTFEDICNRLRDILIGLNNRESCILNLSNFIPEPEKKKELEGWLKDKELCKKILTDEEVSTALDEYQKNLKVAISGDIDAIAKLLGLEKKDVEGKNVHEILNLVCEKNKSHKRQRNIATGITAGFVLTGAGTGAVSVLAISGKLAATLAIPFGAPAAVLIVLSIVGLSFTLYKRSKVISAEKEIGKIGKAKTEIIKGKENEEGIFDIIRKAKNKPDSELGKEDKKFFGLDL